MILSESHFDMAREGIFLKIYLAAIIAISYLGASVQSFESTDTSSLVWWPHYDSDKNVMFHSLCPSSVWVLSTS